MTTQAIALSRAQNVRDSKDGEPYYCTFCGSGWNEYGACEDVRCALESKEAAQSRFKAAPKLKPQIGDYSDIMDE